MPKCDFNITGALFYIANNLLYEPRQSFNIYKMSELESAFIEEINPQNRKIIIGSIYKHPTMDLDDINNNFLNKLI